MKASLHRDASISTTVKLRVIGRQQQLLRIDFESAPSHEVLAAKLDEYERLVDGADAVVLSDYGKGGLEHVAEDDRARRARTASRCWSIRRATTTRAIAARRCSRPTAASSARWPAAGATRPISRARAQKLRADLDLEALIVTRSEEGMSLFTAEARATTRPRGRARCTT